MMSLIGNFRLCLLYICCNLKETLSADSYVYIANGEKVSLHCNNIAHNTDIQWVRLNPSYIVPETVYSIGWTVSKDLPIYNRVYIQGSKNDTNYDLQILNTTTDDSGDYRCILLNGSTVVTNDVTLTVEEKTFILNTRTREEENYVTKSENYVTKSSISKYERRDYMRSTLFLAVGIVGGCLIVLAIVSIICSYAKRNKTAIINTQPIPSVEVDIVRSEMLTSEYSTIGGEPSEDIDNVLISDQSNMEARQNMPPQASHNHDGLNLVTGSGYADSGGYSNPYEPLTDHWSDYTHSYGSTAPQNVNTRDGMKQGQNSSARGEHCYNNTYLSLKKSQINSEHHYN